MSPVVATIRAALGRALLGLPESWLLRFAPGVVGYRSNDIPAPIAAPLGRVRLLIAPVNFAAQGYRWARAAERNPSVGAKNQQYRSVGDFGFPSDEVVPVTVFARSKRWAQGQVFAVLNGFTHVLVEAERPIFGEAFHSDVRNEVAAMRAAGLRVAMVAHGSDLRLPSRHLEREEWSPFGDDDWELVPVLEKQALEHRSLLNELRIPVYVSTPDLLEDWPTATWLPVIVDPAEWQAPEEALRRSRPVVVHAPSNPRIKGTDLIHSSVRTLADQGVIDYRELSGLPAAQMPTVYGEADIVLDQFRLGSYGVAAVEAMAAGRVVVGHVNDIVRDEVRRISGLDLPVVQATVATLMDVLLDIAARPEHYRSIAAQGPKFVRTLHDGRASSEALASFLSEGNSA